MSDEQLYDGSAEILELARRQVARTVNTAMVQAYGLIGREIVEVEQARQAHAGYGDEIIELLSSEAELQLELTREREDAERVLRLTARPEQGGASSPSEPGIRAPRGRSARAGAPARHPRVARQGRHLHAVR